ncbi:MAG: hypothetical protein ACREJQ_05735 [bacterium]
MTFAHKLIGCRKVLLSEFDPADDHGLNAESARAQAEAHLNDLRRLPGRIRAGHPASVALIFQGPHLSGKGEMVRWLVVAISPVPCRTVVWAGRPAAENTTDFLASARGEMPPSGAVSLFNRSYYETVLSERMSGVASEKIWRRRYQPISEFEVSLVNSGALVLKFFLHLSRDELDRRFKHAPPESAPNGWNELQHWDPYTSACQDALTKCSTQEAPWYVIPADIPWLRDLAVAEALSDSLRAFR